MPTPHVQSCTRLGAYGELYKASHKLTGLYKNPKFYIHFHEHSSADQNTKGGKREDVILLWIQHEWALGNV